MFILLKDFDWFGELLPKGTIYVQCKTDKDLFVCHTPNGNICPHKNLTFMTLKNNEEWFLKLDKIRMQSILND